MASYFRYTLFVLFVLSVSKGNAVHTVVRPQHFDARESYHSITIGQFLSLDPNQIQKSNGIKNAWVKRMVIRHAQERLKKRMEKGQLAPESALHQAYAKEGDANKRGKFALIFSGVGFLFLFLGPLAFLTLPLAIAGLILGIIGLQKDRDSTMAIFGIVLGGLTLLLFLLALLIVFTFLSAL